MSEETIFREVDEEVRQQRLKQLWERYGVYLIIVALTVVATVGITKLWQARQIALAQNAAQDFYHTLTPANDPSPISAKMQEEQKQKFAQFIKNAPPIYQSLAQFKIADILIGQEKYRDAVDIYDEIAQNSTQPYHRNLAKIKAAWALIETNPQKAIEKVEELNHNNSPWQNKAREINALVNFNQGNLQQAQKHYLDIINSSNISQSLLLRAGNMLKVIKQRMKNSDIMETNKN